MPYEIQKLGDFEYSRWDVVEEYRLNEGLLNASAPNLTHSLVLAKPRTTESGVGWAWAVFRYLFFNFENSFKVVLREHSQGGVRPAGKVEHFQLFDSEVPEESRAAFEQVNELLQVVLGNGGVSVDEGILQQLILDRGPVPLQELPPILLSWNKSGPLKHPDLQPHLESIDGDGNSLVHHAAEGGYHESVKDLLSHGSQGNPNEGARGNLLGPNAEGNTPLLIAVRNGHFEAALSLLLAGADPNVVNQALGDSPLHIVARQGKTDIVKALAVFGADLDVKNKAGDTPLALAKKSSSEGASECYKLLKELVAETTRPYNDESELQATIPGPFLLCCDGGGVRGLVEVVLLHELERHLCLMCGSDKTLVDCFDWVAGTSTGSLVVSSLVYKKMSVTEVKRSFFHFKDALFSGPRPLPAAETDRVAKEALGDTLVLTDVVQPRVIIPVTIGDYLPPLLHLMCNYGEARQGQKSPSERKVWEAVRASASAPTYFPAFEDKFLDGGLMANNPTLDVMTEVIKVSQSAGQPPQIGLVVSLGTGVAAGEHVDDINIPHVDWWSLSELTEAAQGALNFLKLILSEVTASSGSEVDRAAAWCSAMAAPYIRLSPPISPISLSEIDNKKLVGMMYDTLLYSRRNKEQFRKIAKRLKSE